MDRKDRVRGRKEVETVLTGESQGQRSTQVQTAYEHVKELASSANRVFFFGGGKILLF